MNLSLKLIASSSVLASLFMVMAMPLASAAPSTAEVEAAIKKSSFFSARKQVTVGKFESGEINISTYVEESSENPDKDCKIDALLIAKTLIGSFAEIKRVSVNFYSRSNTQVFKQATITKPEVLSFGSGDVNSDEILSEIKLIDKANFAATGSATKSASGASSQTVARGDGSKSAGESAFHKAVKHGVSPDSQWTQHHISGQEGFPGLSFQFPSVWSVEVSDISPGTSTAFLIKSGLSTYHPALIELKTYRTRGKLSVFNETGIHVREHRDERGYKPIDGGAAAFGAAKSVKGYFENYSVSPEKERMYEYRFYFGWPGYIYVFRSSSAQLDKVKVDALFKTLLNSVRIENSRTR